MPEKNKPVYDADISYEDILAACRAAGFNVDQKDLEDGIRVDGQDLARILTFYQNQQFESDSAIAKTAGRILSIDQNQNSITFCLVFAPGRILCEEFLVPYKLTTKTLSKALGVAHSRISAIANGKRSITPNTAIRLGRYFNTTPGFWMNLQSNYDLAVALKKNGAKIEKTVRPRTN